MDTMDKIKQHRKLSGVCLKKYLFPNFYFAIGIFFQHEKEMFNIFLDAVQEKLLEFLLGQF